MIMNTPDPGQVAVVISDGTRWAASFINREMFEREPARAVADAMKALDVTMARLQHDGVTDESELRHWREADVMHTPRGYALSPAALEEIMKFNYGEERSGDNN